MGLVASDGGGTARFLRIETGVAAPVLERDGGLADENEVSLVALVDSDPDPRHATWTSPID